MDIRPKGGLECDPMKNTTITSEHSPAPWTTKETNDGPSIRSANGGRVAEAYFESDANLIERAPVLLKAVRLCRDNVAELLKSEQSEAALTALRVWLHALDSALDRKDRTP